MKGEISQTEWEQSEVLQDLFPFEDTVCQCCGDTYVGSYLGYDPETTADVPAWNTIWLLHGLPYCEDCFGIYEPLRFCGPPLPTIGWQVHESHLRP